MVEIVASFIADLFACVNRKIEFAPVVCRMYNMVHYT